MPLLTLSGALLLSAVHLFAGKLRFLDVIPRSSWLSFGSGVSVAYVFLHLLPELSHAQQVLQRTAGGVLSVLEHHVYLLAVGGLAAFYGLERLVQSSRAGRQADHPEPGVFWLHTTSFAFYNTLIGYLLAERSAEPLDFSLFLVAMALHFLVNDYGLRQHFRRLYHDRGRWILSAAVIGGGAAGSALRVPEFLLFVPLAFLAGGVMLNVLKEELPAERESRFWAFALGLVTYGTILQVGGSSP